jgi:hypothetical protein
MNARHLALDDPHAEALVFDPLREFELLPFVAQRQQRPRVTGRQLARTKVVLQLLGQFQQPHEVGDGAAVDLDSLGEFVLRTLVFVEVALE